VGDVEEQDGPFSRESPADRSGLGGDRAARISSLPRSVVELLIDAEAGPHLLAMLGGAKQQSWATLSGFVWLRASHLFPRPSRQGFEADPFGRRELAFLVSRLLGLDPRTEEHVALHP
jgi:hypothetical protein